MATLEPVGAGTLEAWGDLARAREALARGAVMVIVNPIPGQESRNSDYLLENGAAIKGNNIATLAYKVDALLGDAERLARLKANVARLGDADREILALRHAQDLSFAEIGCLLEVEPAAARKRFGRALIRLQKLLIEEGVLESRDD